MRLYLVESAGYSDEGADLVIAMDKTSAEHKVAKRYDYQVYACYANEVKEVDGYEVVIRKKV